MQYVREEEITMISVNISAGHNNSIHSAKKKNGPLHSLNLKALSLPNSSIPLK